MTLSTRLTRRVAVIGASLLVATGVMVGAGSATAATCRSYQYSSGGNGTCVSYIQKLANHKLPYIGDRTTIAVDGAFGPLTRAAIIRIQKKWGLTPDGIVGPKTWAALCSQGTVSPTAGQVFSASTAAAAARAGC
jgi:peptidoglycan hydrolase-like protein with peptidoglycan-binding domain